MFVQCVVVSIFCIIQFFNIYCFVVVRYTIVYCVILVCTYRAIKAIPLSKTAHSLHVCFDFLLSILQKSHLCCGSCIYGSVRSCRSEQYLLVYLKVCARGLLNVDFLIVQSVQGRSLFAVVCIPAVDSMVIYRFRNCTLRADLECNRVIHLIGFENTHSWLLHEV